MKPSGKYGTQIEAIADVEGGWVVGVTVDEDYVARQVLRIGGRAVSEAGVEEMPLEEVRKIDLKQFLVAHEEKPGVYSPADGVVLALKNPFDEAEKRIMPGAKIVELHPPVS